MKKLSIDRIEGGYALCEEYGVVKDKKAKDIKMFGIPVAELPEGAKEGCILAIDDEGAMQIDEAEMKKRKEEMKKLQSRAFR